MPIVKVPPTCEFAPPLEDGADVEEQAASARAAAVPTASATRPLLGLRPLWGQSGRLRMGHHLRGLPDFFKVRFCTISCTIFDISCGMLFLLAGPVKVTWPAWPCARSRWFR